MRSAVVCAVLALALTLIAGSIVATSRGTTTSCRLEPSGERRCIELQGDTLIEREGTQFVAVLAVPAVLAVAVLIAVQKRSAWTLAPALLLTFVTLLASASIGLFYIPSAILSLASAGLARRA